MNKFSKEVKDLYIKGYAISLKEITLIASISRPPVICRYLTCITSNPHKTTKKIVTSPFYR